MTKEVVVTGGASEFRWIEITDENGADISGAVIKVALLPLEQRPVALDALDPAARVVVLPSVIRVAILVDATYAPAMYVLWGRIQDVPEVAWIEGGLVEVT